MKHERLKKAVEKFAPVSVIEGKYNTYTAKHLNQIITWCVTWYEKEDGVASLVRVRRANDKDDFTSDYHAGAYYDTIKSAIKSFTWNIQKGEKQ